MIKSLGKGRTGEVMLAEKKDTKELFAFKVLWKADMQDKEVIDRTKAERFIFEKAKGPFVVGLEYAFQTPEKLCFVMRHMSGGSLYTRLHQVGRFSEDEARFYAAEAVLALDYMHSIDIVFRDLKPENILLDSQGHAGLIEFGRAKFVPAGQKATSFVGTVEYMAPEIIRCNGHTKPSDWWSLGILM